MSDNLENYILKFQTDINLCNETFKIYEYIYKHNSGNLNHLKTLNNKEFDYIDYFILKYSDKNKTAIDLGTWVGYFTLSFAKFNKFVIGVEVDPISIKTTKINMKKNNLNNYILYDKPIMHNNDEIIFGPNIITKKQAPWNCSTSMVHTKKKFYEDTDEGHEAIPFKVNSITFNDIVKNYTNDDISFVKIDIEGGEEFVLPDILKFFDRKFPILCSFHIKFPYNYGDWWLNTNLDEIKYLDEYDFYLPRVQNKKYIEIKIENIRDFLTKYPLNEVVIK